VSVGLLIFFTIGMVAAQMQEAKAEKPEARKYGPLLTLLIKKGIVTAQEYEMADAKFEPKPLPESAPVDSLGGPLTYLLIEKGVFTEEELLAEIKDELENDFKPFVPMSNLLMKKGKITEEERNKLCKAWGIEVPGEKPMPTKVEEKPTTPTEEKKPESSSGTMGSPE
jgi:hypothetical protein